MLTSAGARAMAFAGLAALLSPARAAAAEPAAPPQQTPPAAEAPPPATAAAPAADRPPEWLEGAPAEVQARPGEPLRVQLRAIDPDGDAVTYAAPALPAGATLSTRRGAATLEWQTTERDLGPHEVSVEASSGGSKIVRSVHVRVTESDWTGYLLPGAQYAFYAPHFSTRWGYFQGVSIQMVAAAWDHPNDRPGPGHGRVFLDMDVLGSTRAEVSTVFNLSAGAELSFERNAGRRYLVPFYGLELGSLFGKQLASTTAHLEPVGGLYLWFDRRVLVSARAGYSLPLSGPMFDELRGVTAKLGADLSFW